MAEPSKSSSEILNELFSTFNSSFSTSSAPDSSPQKKKKKKAKKSSKKKGDPNSDSSIETRLSKEKKKKKKVLSSVEAGDKKKRRSSSSTTDASKKDKKKDIKKKKPTSSKSSTPSSYKQVIGDGFVVLKNSGYHNRNSSSSILQKELEDGEIIEDTTAGRDEKKKKPGSKKRKISHNDSVLEGLPTSSSSSSSSSSSKKTKLLSASQAYKLDAEEKLLLGYEGSRDRPSSTHHDSGYSKSDSSSSSYKTRDHQHSDHHRSSSSSSRRRSPSPPQSSSSSSRPRLAPPREAYKSSYLKFEKEHTRDYHDSGRSSSRHGNNYDSTSYYDYHAQRGRSNYSTSKGGFGYVGKSYYYDDVEDEEEEQGEAYHRRRAHDYDRGRDRDRDRSSSSSSWRHRHDDRPRSPSSTRRSYYHPDDIIDKSELLEIARKNAKKLMMKGVMPSDIFSRDQILALKAGGKSVEELTMYCKKLAKRDATGDATDVGGSDDSDDEGGRSFIHHPFMVKDKPLPTIKLNIRNAVPLPVRTPQELAIESAKLRTVFPVSSGTQHRIKEIEWKPVSQDDKKEEPNTSTAIVPLDGSTSTSSATGPNVATVAPMMKEDLEEKKDTPENPADAVPEKKTKQQPTGGYLAIEAAPPAGNSVPNNTEQKLTSVEDTGISVDGPDLPLVDIGSVIGLRLKAMRLLQENPSSGEAQRQLDDATQMMKHWADAKALEPKFLTPQELSSGPQAWAKRDQLRKTRALDSGMGMHLLQKMGWKPGEGLGKNKEGQLEPLALDVKTDKKGLTAAVEELIYGKSLKSNYSSSSSGGGMRDAGKGGFGSGGPSMPVVYDLSGKHPVSALMELTAKRRWGNPEFKMCFEHGPPHKRQFVYKVIVNGVEYQPCVAVGNKKQAKANAAAFCLQSLGLLPTGAVGVGESLQTVDSSAGVQEPVVNNNMSSEQSSSLLKQSFSGAGSFLQTVNVQEQQQPQQFNQPPTIPNSQERELMPPPPVPPPLMKFLR